MVRRRRPKREVEFSFDSFLDVVANVVGIILRLILMAWVAARGYQAVVPPPEPVPALAEPEAPPDPTDERAPLLARRRQQLSEEEEAARLAELVKGPDDQKLRRELDELRAAGDAVLSRYRDARSWAERKEKAARAVALSAEELRKRSQAVLAELERLRKLPSLKKQIRYHTPIAAELQLKEVMFECKAGRVTYLDYKALTDLVKNGAQEEIGSGRAGPLVTGTTSAVGAFRARYEYEQAFDTIGGGYRGSFVVVPIDEGRGEPADAALKEGSKYRAYVSAMAPDVYAVTFWVYPDSFALYRKLRDDLHKRGFVVAARPLPLGTPIGASWKGTASRGQ